MTEEQTLKLEVTTTERKFNHLHICRVKGQGMTNIIIGDYTLYLSDGLIDAIMKLRKEENEPRKPHGKL